MASQSGAPAPDAPDIFEQMLERLNGLPAALRQGVVDELYAQIPLGVFEYASTPAAAAGGVVTITPATNTSETIETVIASVPPGAAGLLTLGGATMPLPAGLSSFGARIVLSASDTRSLTILGAAGAAGLWLCGRQAPTYGVIG